MFLWISATQDGRGLQVEGADIPALVGRVFFGFEAKSPNKMTNKHR